MSQSIREAFDRGTEAFNSHDLDAFGELFAEDVVTTAPGGMRAEGKAAATQSYGVWFEGFPDARIDLDHVIITDDAAIEQGTFSGTQTGVLHSPDGDVPPTGRSVKAPYMPLPRRHVVIIAPHARRLRAAKADRPGTAGRRELRGSPTRGGGTRHRRRPTASPRRLL